MVDTHVPATLALVPRPTDNTERLKIADNTRAPQDDGRPDQPPVVVGLTITPAFIDTSGLRRPASTVAWPRRSEHG
jgi:hypothetical protein